jgi:amidase
MPERLLHAGDPYCPTALLPGNDARTSRTIRTRQREGKAVGGWCGLSLARVRRQDRRASNLDESTMEFQPDTVGAFISRCLCGGGAGPLAGLDWATKDLFDVAGTVTGYGNPDWARTHPPAVASAPVVVTLLAAGARLIGKTKTVELAFGMTGANPWYGTPQNPRAPDRFPGGSSCGSAAAVAAGLVDFALGSDTGGSVRIPASYCGLFGIRPSHGAISLAGVCPLAPSLDTVGWFAREAALLERVGAVLLPEDASPAVGPLLRPQEAWKNAEPAVAEALTPALAKLEAVFGAACSLSLAPEGLETLQHAFRAIQSQEVWAVLGNWVTATSPALGADVAARVAIARELPAAEAEAGRLLRRRWQARLRPLLAGGGVLVLPTSPGPAPLLAASAEEVQRVREASLRVTAIAGLAGLPEVTLPAATVDGLPVGLSLVSGAGSDKALLALARKAAGVLGLD